MLRASTLIAWASAAAIVLFAAAIGRGGPDPTQLLPVPDDAAIKAAKKTVREAFKADYAKKKPAEQVDLARKLLKTANETPDDPAARFVMLRDAREFAARGGDVPLAMEAADATAVVFTVKLADLKLAALEMAEQARAAPGAAVAEASLEAVVDAVRADDYVTAERLLKVAASAAGRGKGPITSMAVANRARDVATLRKLFEATEADRKVLAANPNDPAANFRIGRFLCLVKGDWDAGLPLLAKGDDAPFKAAAEKDLAAPATGAERVMVGDAWWDLGEPLDATQKTEARLRAHFWYTQATDLAGLQKIKVDKRVAEVAKLAEQRQAKAGGASGVGWTVLLRSADPNIWNTDTNTGRDVFAIPFAKAPDGVQFLKLAEPSKARFMIIPMTKAQLGGQFEVDGYGWNGKNNLQFRGHHLGIYDTAWTKTPLGKVAIYQKPFPITDHHGWGFGHRPVLGDQQGYSWNGEQIDKAVFEISVKATPLTPGEASKLLKKKN